MPEALIRPSRHLLPRAGRRGDKRILVVGTADTKGEASRLSQIGDPSRAMPIVVDVGIGIGAPGCAVDIPAADCRRRRRQDLGGP